MVPVRRRTQKRKIKLRSQLTRKMSRNLRKIRKRMGLTRMKRKSRR